MRYVRLVKWLKIHPAVLQYILNLSKLYCCFEELVCDGGTVRDYFSYKYTNEEGKICVEGYYRNVGTQLNYGKNEFADLGCSGD